jgi:hypothetical protein
MIFFLAEFNERNDLYAHIYLSFFSSSDRSFFLRILIIIKSKYEKIFIRTKNHAQLELTAIQLVPNGHAHTPASQ